MQSPTAEPCIYIVDDEPALAHMANLILSVRGYRAAVFTDPAKALQHLKNSPSEAVLLITDCIMGGMNGLELIEEFQKQVKSLQTILLSGTITDDFVQRCQIQPDRFLAKPYGADALLDAVEELLGRKTNAASPKQ